MLQLKYHLMRLGLSPVFTFCFYLDILRQTISKYTVQISNVPFIPTTTPQSKTNLSVERFMKDNLNYWNYERHTRKPLCIQTYYKI